MKWNQSGDMDAEQNDQHTADLSHNNDMLLEKGTDKCCRCAKKNENGSKCRNKRQRMQHGLAADDMGRMLGLQVGKRQPGDIGDIGRYQRQYAGGKEGEQAGNEGAEVCDLLG